jgi:hypothetical protein
VSVSIHLHLVPRLRISGAILPLLHAFVACIGRNLLLHLTTQVRISDVISIIMIHNAVRSSESLFTNGSIVLSLHSSNWWQLLTDSTVNPFTSAFLKHWHIVRSDLWKYWNRCFMLYVHTQITASFFVFAFIVSIYFLWRGAKAQAFKEHVPTVRKIWCSHLSDYECYIFCDVTLPDYTAS